MSDEPRPTAPSERIASLDVLRGIAVLGILVINIQLFSMPFTALNNPTVYGDFSGANYWAWFVSHVFAEQKFMTLFSVLFGAGIVLFTRSKERTNQPAIRLHYRRTGWLLLIGLAHAYLLWYGDILVTYALCALWVVRARNWRPRTQFAVGLVLLAIASLIELSLGFALQAASEVAAETWAPSEAALQAELEAYRGGWVEQFEHRASTALLVQTVQFLLQTAWRVTGLMLIGMALFEWGVLSNERSDRFYYRLLAGCGVAGLGLVLAGVWYKEAHDWGLEAAFFGAQFNYWGSALLAGAYVALVMLYCRRRATAADGRALAAVGRTAFSNYLLQTLVATSIFYGHGLGLFGYVSRVEQLAIVALIWALQLPLSVLWLRRFRYGPMEWVWRTLTYKRLEPLTRSERPAATEEGT